MNSEWRECVDNPFFPPPACTNYCRNAAFCSASDNPLNTFFSNAWFCTVRAIFRSSSNRLQKYSCQFNNIHSTHRLNGSKWHKNDFKKQTEEKRREKSKHTHTQTKTKITRESTMNVQIKKITNVNNNRISGRALRFRLDMCECWEFKRKRAHCTVHTQTPYSLPIIVAFVWQSYAKSAMWRNLAHTFATVKFLFAKKYGT